MDPRGDTKQTKAITSAEVIPDLVEHATTTEKMSAYFTIAAAAFGLIKRWLPEQPYDHDQSM